MGENVRTTAEREFADNATDEIVRGHATTVTHVFHPDGSSEIRDDGRGLPAEVMFKETGMNGICSTIGTTGAGENYSGSGTTAGTHGEGAAAAVAISRRVDVTVFRNGKMYFQSFKDGRPGFFADGDGFDPDAAFTPNNGASLKPQTSPAGSPEHGTQIRYLFDEDIARNDDYDPQAVVSTLKMNRLLTPGMNLTLVDKDGTSETLEAVASTGAAALMQELMGVAATSVLTGTYELSSTPDRSGNVTRKDVEYEVAFVPTSEQRVLSFVNSVHTSGGGNLVNAIVDSLGKGAASKNLRGLERQPGEPYPSPEDFSESVSAVVTMRYPAPEFTSQDKHTVSETKRYVNLTRTEFERTATAWAAAAPNSQVLLEWAKFALVTARTKQKMAAAKQSARKSAGASKPGTNLSLPDKYVPCEVTGRGSGAELHICEGDSALGTIKASRSAVFQAAFPLRGKPVKSWGKNVTQLRKNEEFAGIEALLGTGVRENCDPEKCRFDRIIFSTDADPDGYNISASLTSMFVSNFLPLIEEGMVYIALPPLFIVSTEKADERFYAVTEADRDAAVERYREQGRKRIEVQRCKGLGEMLPKDFKTTVMDPETRALMQIRYEPGRDDDTLETVFGPSAEGRRSWMADMAALGRADMNDIMD